MSQKLRNEELNRLSVDAFKNAEKQPVIILLDNIRSLNNVGSAFRTADAFLIEEIILCGVTGTPPNKEIEKTALGATSTVKWRHVKTTLEAVIDLKQKKYRVYAVEQAKKSISLNSFTLNTEKTALVFGNEVYGVDQAVINECNGVIEIPQAGTKHSLNVSVSIGIVLWEILKNKFQ
jgi:23S rRNA (guanosine2251-2'-O)-methyltransferase